MHFVLPAFLKNCWNFYSCFFRCSVSFQWLCAENNGNSNLPRECNWKYEPYFIHLTYLCLWSEAWKELWLVTESGSLQWLGMWRQGQLLTCTEEDRHPEGFDCGSWYVSKNRQPASSSSSSSVLHSRCWSMSVFRRKQLLSRRERRTSF